MLQSLIESCQDLDDPELLKVVHRWEEERDILRSVGDGWGWEMLNDSDVRGWVEGISLLA